jgi:nucleoside-diphosphate-sugar epimerase
LVTVFGGTGFLGRRIVERLGATGARVRLAVRHTMMKEVPPQGGDVEVVYADVRDGTTFARAVRDSDAVVNAVGLYVEQGEATLQAVHVDGAQEVARVAREAGIPRLVHISGIGADVNSESSYVRSRALGDVPYGRRLRRLPSSAPAFSSAEETPSSGPLRRSRASHPSSPFLVTDRHGSSLSVMSQRR